MRKSLLVVFLLVLAVACICPVFAQDYTPRSGQGISVEAQTVTNGQAVTLVLGINVLTSAGQADTYTNTITIANVASKGALYWIVNADASTNTVALAKTGNWKTAAVTLAAGEMVPIVSTATNALRAAK